MSIVNCGAVMGVQISEYLLEKSRIVEQHMDERCFHVFYYLFASPLREQLGLTSPGDFGCVFATPSPAVPWSRS